MNLFLIKVVVQKLRNIRHVDFLLSHIWVLCENTKNVPNKVILCVLYFDSLFYCDGFIRTIFKKQKDNVHYYRLWKNALNILNLFSPVAIAAVASRDDQPDLVRWIVWSSWLR